MDRAGKRRHERVLDRAFPAFPRDGLGQDLEDDAEVRPDDGADQQRRRRAIDVELAAGGVDALGDEDDRERVRERPDEERELPPDVALDQVGVPLEHAGEADQLVAEGCGSASHANTPLSASSSSCSNSRPVAAKKASSSVSAR